MASKFRASKSILYPWSEYRDNGNERVIYQEGAVTSWENLKDYAMLYQNPVVQPPLEIRQERLRPRSEPSGQSVDGVAYTKFRSLTTGSKNYTSTPLSTATSVQAYTNSTMFMPMDPMESASTSTCYPSPTGTRRTWSIGWCSNPPWHGRTIRN